MSKNGVLRAIGHNMADSMASGCGLLVGVWSMNVFAEAARSSNGHIIVDFLNGEILAGDASVNLQKAAKRYSEALPDFCTKHGAQIAEFQRLEARVGLHLNRRPRFIVTIDDRLGRTFVDTYFGLPGRRARIR